MAGKSGKQIYGVYPELLQIELDAIEHSPKQGGVAGPMSSRLVFFQKYKAQGQADEWRIEKRQDGREPVDDDVEP